MFPMMSLGNYIFGIDTAAYQSLRKTSEYRWPRLDRIGRNPAHQFTGPSYQSVEVDGVIYPQEFGSVDQVDQMRGAAETGDPLKMIVSPQVNVGVVLGSWVITRIEETHTIFLPGGIPRKIEFRVAVSYYGPDSIISLN